MTRRRLPPAWSEEVWASVRKCEECEVPRGEEGAARRSYCGCTAAGMYSRAVLLLQLCPCVLPVAPAASVYCSSLQGAECVRVAAPCANAGPTDQVVHARGVCLCHHVPPEFMLHVMHGINKLHGTWYTHVILHGTW